MQLNSYKTYKDKWLLVVIWMIVAYCLMLFPLLWGQNKEMVTVEKYIPSKHDIKISQSKKEWQPWDLNQAKDAQEMPVLIETESHQRFIELCERYNLPADVIWNTENYYGLKEWTILCISIAETSGGKNWWWKDGCWNYWNIWNNDSWNRRCYSNQWAWFDAIWRTLNNNYLKNNQTIACLNWAWDCIEPNASSKRYSTGKSWNWQRNMIGCFYSIYQTPINPQTFNLHQR